MARPHFRLSSEERAELEQFVHSGADPKAVRRTQILLWVDDGESVLHLAMRLKVTKQAIYGQIKRFKERSSLPVLDRVKDGRYLKPELPVMYQIENDHFSARKPPKHEFIKNELLVLLANSPAIYGYIKKTWTIGMLMVQLERNLNLGLNTLNASHVSRALHELGYFRLHFVKAPAQPDTAQSTPETDS